MFLPRVERVLITLPQPQVASISSYAGCKSAFMVIPRFCVPPPEQPDQAPHCVILPDTEKIEWTGKQAGDDNRIPPPRKCHRSSRATAYPGRPMLPSAA